MEKQYKANSLEKAFKEAKFLDYENNMQTIPIVVEREYEKVKIIRKCPSLDHSEIFLIIVRPQPGYKEPNLKQLGKDIKKALDLYGDIAINFKERKNKGCFDAVINVF